MANGKKKLLTNVVIKELSLVDRPANGGARVSVWKRDGDAPSGANNSEGDDSMDIEALAKSLEEAEARMATLEEDVKKGQDENKRLADENAELKKAAESKDDAAGEGGEEINKSDLPEAVAKRLDDIEKRNTELEAQVAKAAENEATATYVAKAKELDGLTIKADEFGPVLGRIAKNKATDDDMAEIDRVLKAASEAAKSVTAEKGADDSTASNDAEKTLTELATKRANDKGESFAKAYAAVMDERPDLYDEVMKAASK